MPPSHGQRSSSIHTASRGKKETTSSKRVRPREPSNAEFALAYYPITHFAAASRASSHPPSRTNTMHASSFQAHEASTLDYEGIAETTIEGEEASKGTKQWYEVVPYLRACTLSEPTLIYQPIIVPESHSAIHPGRGFPSFGLTGPPPAPIAVQTEVGPFNQHFMPRSGGPKSLVSTAAAAQGSSPVHHRAISSSSDSSMLMLVSTGPARLAPPEAVDWEEEVVKAASRSTAAAVRSSTRTRASVSSSPTPAATPAAATATEGPSGRPSVGVSTMARRLAAADPPPSPYHSTFSVGQSATVTRGGDGATAVLRFPLSTRRGGSSGSPTDSVSTRRRDVSVEDKFVMRSQKRKENNLLSSSSTTRLSGGGSCGVLRQQPTSSVRSGDGVGRGQRYEAKGSLVVKNEISPSVGCGSPTMLKRTRTMKPVIELMNVDSSSPVAMDVKRGGKEGPAVPAKSGSPTASRPHPSAVTPPTPPQSPTRGEDGRRPGSNRYVDASSPKKSETAPSQEGRSQGALSRPTSEVPTSHMNVAESLEEGKETNSPCASEEFSDMKTEAKGCCLVM